ncbi:MAG TPA: hypothetical protein VF858_10200 [Gemmatimonadaceae bacterium]
MADDRKPFSRRSPQPSYTEIPDYYENDDIPHVLARVRFMLEFSKAAEEKLNLNAGNGAELLGVHMDLLAEVLAPYALALALSLIALEDSVDPEEAEP